MTMIRRAVLGSAILMVSAIHERKPQVLNFLKKIAGEERKKMSQRFPESTSLPPRLSVFIKSRQEFLADQEYAVPSAPYFPLDLIGVFDRTVAMEPSEKNVRWLMAQQICRLVFAANTLKWDYTAAGIQPALRQKTALIEAFLKGKAELPIINLHDLQNIGTGSIPSGVEAADCRTRPKSVTVMREVLLDRLETARSDEDLLVALALAHDWNHGLLYQGNRDRKVAFCLALASAVTGIEIEKPLGFFPFNKYIRAAAQDFSPLGEDAVNDFFAGNITYDRIGEY